MEDAYKAGKIRAIGVSNFYPHVLTNFCETVEIRPAVNQVELHPYFTQTGKDREDNGDQYIANMRDGATAGFKYFTFDGTETTISVRGKGDGKFLISTDPDGKEVVAAVPVNGTGACNISEGVHALYFRYEGTDTADFTAFTIA